LKLKGKRYGKARSEACPPGSLCLQELWWRSRGALNGSHGARRRTARADRAEWYRLGRTYQISQLFLNLTVEENLFLAAAANQGVEFNFLSSWRKRTEFVQRAHKAAEQVNLTPYLSKLVSELSHGLQRQLEIRLEQRSPCDRG
jgi:ABC-type branched-subunit amino acid transport system ATPase component